MRSSPEGDRKALWSLLQERNPCINTRTQHESATNSIARKGVQRVNDPLVGSRGNAPWLIVVIGKEEAA